MGAQELTMHDISMMYVEYVIKNAKRVTFFYDDKWWVDPNYTLLDCKCSAMWSMGAKLLQVLSEGDDHVVIKDLFQKDPHLAVMKFTV